MTYISKRLRHFDSAEFRKVFQRKQALTNPYDLSIGIPEEFTHETIKQAAIQAIQNNHTNYTPANGIPELRELIAKKLRVKNNILVDAERVSVVPGLTTGLLLLYMTLFDPGDEVIIMDPFYPPYEQLAGAVGARAVSVPTFPTFELNIDAIKTRISDRTRAVVVNTPNNPTGKVYSKESLIELAKLAGKHNLTIISDEIYESFIYDGQHFSIGSLYPNTITMHGFSKEYAMTGWRLGYISGPLELINAVNELQQYVVFSSSSIAQYAAIEAIKQDFSWHREKYRVKRDLVVDVFERGGYEIRGAEGAYYMFVQTPEGWSDVDFVEKAAENNVLIVPSRAFSARKDFIRISYGAPVEVVRKGMHVLINLTNSL